MKNLHHSQCLGNFDFASYMAGTVYDEQRESIEQHLSDCDFCFETLISVLNQNLNQADMLWDSDNVATPAYQFA